MRKAMKRDDWRKMTEKEPRAARPERGGGRLRKGALAFTLTLGVTAFLAGCGTGEGNPSESPAPGAGSGAAVTETAGGGEGNGNSVFWTEESVPAAWGASAEKEPEGDTAGAAQGILGGVQDLYEDIAETNSAYERSAGENTEGEEGYFVDSGAMAELEKWQRENHLD